MSLNFLSLLLHLAIENANSTVHQIQTIAKYKNHSEDVCNNFYDYTCGRWSEKHSNQSYKEIIGLIDYEVNIELRNLFRSHQNGTNIMMDKVWTYLKSCEMENKPDYSNYLKLVKPAKGLNWPLMGELNVTRQEQSTDIWQREKFNWLITLANLRKFGLNSVFLEQLVLQNYDNAATYITDIDKPSLEDKPKLPDPYTIMAVLNSAGLSLSKAYKLNIQLRDFELKLFNLQKSSPHSSIIILTLAELRAELPQLDWSQYFKILTNQNVDDNFKIQIRNLAYIKQLAGFLSAEEPELICNYFMLHFLFYAVYDSSTTQTESDCMVDVRTKMDLAINFIYYENFFKQNADTYQNDVNSIFEIIRIEFRKRLNENTMKFNSIEIEHFINKLNAMKLKIGNVPMNIDQEFVEEYYKDIELHAEHYIRNQLDLLQLRFRKEHDRLTHPPRDVDDFFAIADKDLARSSTPFYSPRQNLVTMPFGFLRAPVYQPEMHDALKYSLLGFNMAHEMAHGFDLDGILYDDQGNLSLEIAEDVMRNSVYAGLYDCLQESKTSAVNERFADFLGLQLAWDAFSQRNSSLEAAVFGQPLMQIFFFNLSQFFCGSLDADFIDHDADNDRLEWILTQYGAFSKAFNCKQTDKMPVQTKCHFW